MSIVTIALGLERWYPKSLRPRIEAGTRNVMNHTKQAHDENVERWRNAFAGQDITRRQIQYRLGVKNVNGMLSKMRNLGYIEEVGTLSGAKLWRWNGGK